MDIKKLIQYPLVIFKNKWVLRSVIFSTLFLAIFLVIINVCYDIFFDFYKRNIFWFNFIKNTLYSYLQIASVGYLISKHKMCFWSILSFYIIIYLKLSWIVDQYVIRLPFWFTRIESVLLVSLLVVIIYLIFKQWGLIKKIK